MLFTRLKHKLKLCRYRTLPRSELWEKAVAWCQAHWCYLQAYSIDQQMCGRASNDAKVGQTTALQRREKRLGRHTLGVAQ